MAADVRHRLAILADAAKYDASCASSGSQRAQRSGGLGNSEGMGICHSYTPDGRCVSLLKILLTNAVQPEVVLCLGATAAQSFLGPRFSITRNRGRVFETPWAKAFIVTYHPSAILRMEEGPAAEAYRDLVADLKLAWRHADRVNPAAAPHPSIESP